MKLEAYMAKVIVLGGCGAVGSVAVKTLAAQDIISKVVIGDWNIEKAKKLAKELGPKVSAVKVNAEDDESIKTAVSGCDIVLNCVGPFYKTVKKYLRKLLKDKELDKMEYYKAEMCPMRMSLLNELCEETNSAVVLSASMRSGWNVEQLQEIFNYCGATFTIIDKTGYCDCRIRGVEILNWLRENCMKWFGVHDHEFSRYAIIDDDSDMLLWQQYNFFQVDNYSGLTPNTIYKIERFFNYTIKRT